MKNLNVFKNYLKNNPNAANEYEEFKRKLSLCCQSKDEYINAKAAFIKSIEKELFTTKITFQVRKANLEKERERIIAYLRPFEVYALFLIGNLEDKGFPSSYYIAIRGEEIVGVAAFFPIFQSFSLFTEYPEVAREIVRFVPNKDDIRTLLGISSAAKYAYEEFLKLGYKSENIPKAVFMELNLRNFRFYNVKEGIIRPIEEKDIDQVVILHRYIHNLSSDLPITENERNKIRFSKAKYCLEVDNKIVSSAVSNGLVGETFQILGVSTHPDYRRRGFAKAICSTLISHFQEKAKKCFLFTDYDNMPAIKCYHALGFNITDEYYVASF